MARSSSATPTAWKMRPISWSKCTARGRGYGCGHFSNTPTRHPRCRAGSRASARPGRTDDRDVVGHVTGLRASPTLTAGEDPRTWARRRARFRDTTPALARRAGSRGARGRSPARLRSEVGHVPAPWTHWTLLRPSARERAPPRSSTSRRFRLTPRRCAHRSLRPDDGSSDRPCIRSDQASRSARRGPARTQRNPSLEVRRERQPRRGWRCRSRRRDAAERQRYLGG